MARPKKQTVDYFPHCVRHGQTMEILEQEYGLMGYAFWWKLLERLGDAEGHFLDCKNPVTWKYLQTKTRQNEQTTEEILNLLADLDAIDGELWKATKVIWCQKFVDGIADVYRNRIVDIPIRPNISCKKPSNGGVSDVRNPQTKLKESKLKKTKKDIPPFPLPEDFQISERVLTWARKNNFNHLETHLEAFKLRAQAKGYKYKDWDAAFMTAIRENWGKIQDHQPTGLCPHGTIPRECKICRDYLPQAASGLKHQN